MQGQNDKGLDQRKFKRIDQHFIAKFQTAFSEPENWHTIFLRDLGAGGVLFNHSSELKVSSHIDLSITFPMSKTPLICSAIVIRVRCFEIPLKVYEIAACFTELDEAQKELIERGAETYFLKKKGRRNAENDINRG